MEIPCKPGNDLVENDVDPAHVLTVERSEIMTAADAEPRVRVHVLDNVPDVHYAAFFAPVADHAREIISVEFRHCVHVSDPDAARLFLSHSEPERGEKRNGIESEFFPHHRDNPVVPRKRETRHSEPVVVPSHVDGMRTVPAVSELRFVGEKARDRRSEPVTVHFILGFVNSVDKELRAALVKHVDIVALRGASPRFIEENQKDLAASLEKTVVEVLMDKLSKAVKITGINRVAVAGGVSANTGLRQAFMNKAEKSKWTVYIPPFSYTTDNGAMIAIAGYFKYQDKVFCSLEKPAYSRVTFE